MYIILLKFINRERAGAFMEGHMQWLKQGFEDDIFILAGGIKPQLGGAIIAKNSSLELIQKRVDQDPFVSEKVVEAEILEISPSKFDERFADLLKA
ncbi:hypothetical protein AZI85_08560 [Bdellovibrio bacteriovorus]|uniref:YCII-related domain-containing protein n=1 Tax=Bdellovibrio bacteriovorus TaxID=959 RepID=A0A150WDG1_BDEBC|nr:YciI family protein [Bdellovibrio bacteriovorus]KYG61003.1 hypothetical protein AZI85_08560 [Bdellovibrio bacteriovorus]